MRCVRAPHHAALEGEPHCLQQLPVADECEVDRRWLPTRQWRTVAQRQQRGPFFTSREESVAMQLHGFAARKHWRTAHRAKPTWRKVRTCDLCACGAYDTVRPGVDVGGVSPAPVQMWQG